MAVVKAFGRFDQEQRRRSLAQNLVHRAAGGSGERAVRQRIAPAAVSGIDHDLAVGEERFDLPASAFGAGDLVQRRHPGGLIFPLGFGDVGRADKRFVLVFAQADRGRSSLPGKTRQRFG